MANQFFIEPANPLQALMLGQQGYDRGRDRLKQQQLSAARQAAQETIMSGGDNRSALAQLLGAGDTQGANVLAQYQNNANSVYGTPIYGTRPDGTTAIGTFDKSGTFKEIATPGFTPTPGVRTIDTGTGTVLIDSRTGRPMGGGATAQPNAGPMPSGTSAAQPPAGANGYFPKDVAGAARQGVVGKAEGEAVVGLPETLAKAEQAVAVIDSLLKHPGRAAATGLSGQLDPRNYIAGTSATDFRVALKQLEGKAFLEAFESLKGGGQITEVEGNKATQAVARLDRAQSDKEFVSALNDLKRIVTTGMDRARMKASQPQQAPAPVQSQPQGQAGTRRSIGGRNFVQINGQWYEE